MESKVIKKTILFKIIFIQIYLFIILIFCLIPFAISNDTIKDAHHPSLIDQKDIYDLFKKEIKAIPVKNIEGIENYIFAPSYTGGDLIIENFDFQKMSTIKDYLNEKYSFSHFIEDKILSVKISDKIIVQKCEFINSIDKIELRSAIVIMRKNKNNKNTFDFFSIFSKIEALKVPKLVTNRACYKIFGFEFFCEKDEYFDISTDIELTYIYENILEKYKIEKFQSLFDENALNIFLESEHPFDIIKLDQSLDYFNRQNRLEENNKFLAFLEYDSTNKNTTTVIIPNVSNKEEEKGYLASLFNFINKYRLFYSEKKIEIDNMKEKYVEIFSQKNSENSKNTRIQIVSGIKTTDVNEYLKRLKNKYDIPKEKQDDFDFALESSLMSSKNLWTYIDFLYSVNDKGKVKFMAVFSHQDKNDVYNFVICEILLEFALGNDIIISQKTNSSLMGLVNFNEQVIQEIPNKLDSQKIQEIHKILSDESIRSLSKYFKLDD